MSTTQTFYVQSLDVAITSELATIAGAPSVIFDTDVVAQFELSATTARAIFQYAADGFDVNDITAEDLKYLVNYDSTLYDDVEPTTGSGEAFTGTGNWLLDNFMLDACYCTGPGNGSSVANDELVAETTGMSANSSKTISKEFLRYLAKKLFNTTRGVDLFNNELDVSNKISYDGRNALNTRLAELNTDGLLNATEATSGSYATFNHPSHIMVSQLLSSDPERFQDISANIVADQTLDADSTDVKFHVPLITGDKIAFKLTISPATNQETVTNVSAIENRTYRVEIVLTE